MSINDVFSKKVSKFAPTTRTCITNAPLCPIASFTMANIGQINNEHAALCPHAGSCALLLSCAKLAPKCKTVGVEIANDYYVNFNDTRKDFDAHDLHQPAGYVRGNFRKKSIRDEARNQIIECGSSSSNSNAEEEKEDVFHNSNKGFIELAALA